MYACLFYLFYVYLPGFGYIYVYNLFMYCTVLGIYVPLLTCFLNGGFTLQYL